MTVVVSGGKIQRTTTNKTENTRTKSRIRERTQKNKPLSFSEFTREVLTRVPQYGVHKQLQVLCVAIVVCYFVTNLRNKEITEKETRTKQII